MTLGIQIDTRKTELLAKGVKVFDVQGPIFIQNGGQMKNIFGHKDKGTSKNVANTEDKGNFRYL